MHGVERRRQAGVGQRIDVDVDLEAVDLTPEPVAPHRMSTALSSAGRPGRRGSPSRAGSLRRRFRTGRRTGRIAQRFEQVEPLGQHRHGGRLAAGQDGAVDGVELVGPAPRRRTGTPGGRRCRPNAPLKGGDPDGHQPRSREREPSIWSITDAGHGRPGPSSPWRDVGVARKWVVASTIALTRNGVVGLEDPGADEHTALRRAAWPRRPQGGDASGAEQQHRQNAGLGDLLHQRQRGPQLPARSNSSAGRPGSAADVAGDRAGGDAPPRRCCRCRPLALQADHAGTLGDASQRLAQGWSPARTAR